MLPRLALHLRKIGERLLDFAEHGFERILFDARIAAERRERLALTLEPFIRSDFRSARPATSAISNSVVSAT
jgi:hypothetical protein